MRREGQLSPNPAITHSITVILRYWTNTQHWPSHYSLNNHLALVILSLLLLERIQRMMRLLLFWVVVIIVVYYQSKHPFVLCKKYFKNLVIMQKRSLTMIIRIMLVEDIIYTRAILMHVSTNLYIVYLRYDVLSCSFEACVDPGFKVHYLKWGD
jgi:hypothetical protein